MSEFKSYLRAILHIIRKDIAVEWRGRQGVPVMLVFALLIVFLFNFALQLDPDLQAGLAAGLLWISIAFASTLGLNRSISLERENNALDGLLLIPVDRSAIFFRGSTACSSPILPKDTAPTLSKSLGYTVPRSHRRISNTATPWSLESRNRSVSRYTRGTRYPGVA